MQRRKTFPQPYHLEMQEAWAYPREPWADAFQWALQLKLIQRHGCPTNLRARVWPFLLGFDMSSWEDAESLYTKLRQLAASAEAAQAFCLSQGAPEDYYPGVQRMLDVDVPRAPRNCPFLQVLPLL
ncbi:hypothetical protein DUNSADRAFT_2143 [Dunaliella salina]|uniref:Rab-GAP TBC domain-containing protein n=1 Tax=Dunaliella salina TaxID=3046 RepID=A0ABQ7H8C8_DUNSA|nr:hypothetical protein DUNSADRAFT_2143 [Dunaliella salina]|eukprot:KAF5843106.1 hypothetical protein DUNSADRAFT_2143 [Dunaliella salina]